MVALVRAEVSLRGIAGHVALVQLGRPDLLFALRRLANGAVLGEPRDPLGLHPVVIRPGLPRDRLQRLHGVEARKAVLHRGRPQVIRQVPGAALRLHGLPVRGRAEAGGGRGGRVEPAVGVLGILDVGGVEVAVARLQRAIVLMQVQGRADAGRGGRGAAEAPLVRRCPYLVRDRGIDPRGRGRSASGRASFSVAVAYFPMRGERRGGGGLGSFLSRSILWRLSLDSALIVSLPFCTGDAEMRAWERMYVCV